MGTTIFLHSWISAIAAIIILPFAWIKRMNYEEEMLIDNFGNEYRDYCKDVKRVIPGLW
jgi:protein-S-isoprenylcysteine O-methyltransferase Ste14